MSERREAVERFLDEVGRTPELWRSIDFRAIAVRTQGHWHNLLTRCYLDSRPPEEVTRFASLPVSDDVGCWQFVLQISRLADLLDGVARGEFVVGDVCIQYRAVQAPSPQQPYNFGGYGFSDLSESYRLSYRFWSCHDLTASGNSVHDLAKTEMRHRLDNAVRVSSVPFDGLNGLARFAVGSSDRLDPSRVCLFEIFAPLEALIAPEACSFEKGVLRFSLKAGSREAAERVELKLFGLGAGPLPLNQTFKPGISEWKFDGTTYRFTGELALDDCQTATLMLCVGPFCVHRMTLADAVGNVRRNSRIEAYRVFDSKLSVLRDGFAGQGSDGAARFDAAVARLIAFLGFIVNRLSGDGRLSEAVDLLVHVPAAGVCIAVECTTGALGSKGKLAKLVARVDSVRRALPDFQVQGMMVTSLETSQIAKADMEAAARDKLMVICREDLDELLTFALASTPVNDVLAFLQTRVPPVPQQHVGRRMV